MNTRLNILAMTTAAMLLSLAWTGSSLAQERAPAMPAPELDRVSCDEVDWHRDMLREYPWVVEACHEAIVIDGQKWARFQADFQQFNRDGTITSDFKSDRGRSLGTVTLKPGPDQRVLLDGNPTQFSDLRRGQVLNFYAPEGMYAFTTQPGAPRTEQVEIVRRQDIQTERQLAEPERDRTTTTRRDTLPATAGPLPIIALGGLLSLLGGFTLTMRRRFIRKSE
jgi:hypothetical protein